MRRWKNRSNTSGKRQKSKVDPENKLKTLFEYARFVGDPKIEKLAAQTLAEYPEELGDGALESVSAAGDLFEETAKKPDENSDK